MPVAAFEGPAGTGKTHSLMARLGREVERRELASQERVLALTFMHGSRHRLECRLREVEEVGGRFEATTLDSFAWRLCQRWRLLATSLGHPMPADGDYDDTCRLAAALLARPVVGAWVYASYPFVVVDEAQDLNAARSMMIREMAGLCRVLLAFDEFQCLDPALRPMAILEWLPGVCEPVRLARCRRTEEAELLNAARALRRGEPVGRGGKRFKVVVTPGKPNLAATYLANAIHWRGGGSVAVLTPTRSGGFAEGIVSLVCSSALGKRQIGPYRIEWEGTADAERRTLCDKLAMPAVCGVAEALARLERHLDVAVVKSVTDWLRRKRSVLGSYDVTAEEVERRIDRALGLRRRYWHGPTRQLSAMTIQQAKNREFGHVVVVWPYRVRNDDQQKRRLLYNAITRAQRSCLVLVQAETLAQAPPFVG